jgi:hypothetical protein
VENGGHHNQQDLVIALIEESLSKTVDDKLTMSYQKNLLSEFPFSYLKKDSKRMWCEMRHPFNKGTTIVFILMRMIGGKKKLLNSRQYIHIVTAFQGYQYDS